MGRTTRLLGAALTAVVLALGSVGATHAAVSDSDGDGLSNAFETLYGLNPNARDTDGNGVLDPAEDPDGDGLSNLGEQRFGTNPLVADTNGNGIPDGADDSNHDGIPDGIEQDNWAVPANLTPSLQNARSDRPLGYTDGCHTTIYDSTIHPCAYGAMNASRTIAVFADSHGQQWMPALIAVARAHHWRIISLTKSGCPTVQVVYQNLAYPGAEASCKIWRRRGEAWLRAHPPDVIVVSNTRGYRLLDSHGHVLTGTAFEAGWRMGLEQTLRRLPVSSVRVVVGDTPHMLQDIPKCLRSQPDDVSACETSRATAWRRAHDLAESAAAASGNATFVSLNAAVCPYDPCPIVVNNLLIWRDSNHMTATYSAQLAPAVVPFLQAALAAASAAQAPLAWFVPPAPARL